MNCYTYFNADEAREGDGELLRLWRLSWERRGWTPRILTPRSAAQHPQYAEAMKTCPGALRWLAFEQAGGGWFSEFDCINYSFSPQTPDVDFSRCGNYPAFFSATDAGAKCLAQDILMPCHGFPNVSHTLTGCCLDMGAPDWESAPVVHFSPQSIFRHFGCEIPAWKVITNLSRRF